MMKKRAQFWVVVLALAVLLPSARAQQQKDPRLNPPVAPIQSITADESSSKAPAGEPAAPATAKPDDGPLSGAQAFTSGWSNARSFLQASIRYTQVADNSLRTPTSKNDWRSIGAMFGQMSLDRTWPRNHLKFDYRGGGLLFSTSTFNRSMIHNFGFSDQLSFRRVTFMFADSLTYVPESSFGGGGIGGIAGGFGGLGNGGFGWGAGGQGGGFGSGFTPGLTPGQSILTGIGDRLSNAVLGQMSLQLTRRSSLTMGGSFGMLRYFKTGFIESNNYQYRAGYDYKLTATDTVALVYQGSQFRFSGVSRAANNHSVLVTYGRQLTGRMALRIAGGPRFVIFENPVAGSTTRASWSTTATLSYILRNLDLGLSYSHLMSAGSGVLFGANTDRVELTAHRQLSRMWDVSFQTGYALNKSIRQLNATPFNRTIHAWHAGFHLQRPIGRKARLLFTYTLNGQNANNPVGCVGITCGNLPLRHRFGLGLSWGFGPYNID